MCGFTADEAPTARELLQSMAEAVVYADRQGVIRSWNAGAEVLFGHPASAAIGRSLDLIIPEHLRAGHWRGFEKAMASGVTRYGRQSMITRALSATGEAIYVDMSFAVVRAEDGKVIGSVAVARDATARFLEERRLRQRLAELEMQLGTE